MADGAVQQTGTPGEPDPVAPERDPLNAVGGSALITDDERTKLFDGVSALRDSLRPSLFAESEPTTEPSATSSTAAPQTGEERTNLDPPPPPAPSTAAAPPVSTEGEAPLEPPSRTASEPDSTAAERDPAAQTPEPVPAPPAAAPSPSVASEAEPPAMPPAAPEPAPPVREPQTRAGSAAPSNTDRPDLRAMLGGGGTAGPGPLQHVADHAQEQPGPQVAPSTAPMPLGSDDEQPSSHPPADPASSVQTTAYGSLPTAPTTPLPPAGQPPARPSDDWYTYPDDDEEPEPEGSGSETQITSGGAAASEPTVVVPQGGASGSVYGAPPMPAGPPSPPPNSPPPQAAPPAPPPPASPAAAAPAATPPPFAGNPQARVRHQLGGGGSGQPANPYGNADVNKPTEGEQRDRTLLLADSHLARDGVWPLGHEPKLYNGEERITATFDSFDREPPSVKGVHVDTDRGEVRIELQGRGNYEVRRLADAAHRGWIAHTVETAAGAHEIPLPLDVVAVQGVDAMFDLAGAEELAKLALGRSAGEIIAQGKPDLALPVDEMLELGKPRKIRKAAAERVQNYVVNGTPSAERKPRTLDETLHATAVVRSNAFHGQHEIDRRRKAAEIANAGPQGEPSEPKPPNRLQERFAERQVLPADPQEVQRHAQHLVDLTLAADMAKHLQPTKHHARVWGGDRQLSDRVPKAPGKDDAAERRNRVQLMITEAPEVDEYAQHNREQASHSMLNVARAAYLRHVPQVLLEQAGVHLADPARASSTVAETVQRLDEATLEHLASVEWAAGRIITPPGGDPKDLDDVQKPRARVEGAGKRAEGRQAKRDQNSDERKKVRDANKEERKNAKNEGREPKLKKVPSRRSYRTRAAVDMVRTRAAKGKVEKVDALISALGAAQAGLEFTDVGPENVQAYRDHIEITMRRTFGNERGGRPIDPWLVQAVGTTLGLRTQR